MRKVLLLTLCLVLASSAALAEVDLAGMSYDDLLALQNAVTVEIMGRPEWKEVEVPAGQYTIGVDIPAGWYSVQPKNGIATLRYYPIPGEDYWDYFTISDVLGRYEFTDGLRIMLDDTAIFAPPLALGF